ncbi:8-amino-7-oxononanoate synthase [Desulfolithobacter dissulfuricans]|uniref:8-amino-7-oxononanoate synthase n=1 Tax=Desulfolithobacter dissulfuricans TaxID=2795293 RepID=A0A915XLE8_9BACT|nr:8-amino-7-oxononanoate synthase [Desulfolithobacter dissulfuricans]BCO10648.1 8-amino-7-oxononanoate synthase [Desulfolithobacter dissulfuricans]
MHKRLAGRLERLEDEGLRRNLVELIPGPNNRIRVGGRDYLNLAGNDYLGLAADPGLVRRFYDSLDDRNLLERFAPGARASRLMTGNSSLYRELETRLATLYGSERALVFNSGYHINIGILPALATRDDLILADKLCHASLIDGMRLSRAEVIRYPHLDYQRIRTILEQKRERFDQVFLVTESIFSMDGDLADLGELVRIRDEFDLCLYVDEAHAVGVAGRQGLGLAEEQNVSGRIDLLVGTFGKAWGGQGAFVACSDIIADGLINQARSLIFTTGLPPVNLHWLLFLSHIIPGMEEKRDRLRAISAWLREGLLQRGLRTGGNSQIVPVMIGDASRTVAVAERLREAGFWVNGVRPPTVPPGTSRLRFSLSATMTEEELATLPDRIESVLA